ncbi:X-linked retinitis pigmentosa GTPase regulator [Fopius arisanus]|uniref:X-linked retinitis pigmentosa GTPase regulator n=1 Tax=Fopius arisanus TaxID=64838 RepID=A0A9R1SZS8_9HYME|nr:PREDICTED: X-linked retinitis pigmentosa GTPase regulator [Fopius arisanus]
MGLPDIDNIPDTGAVFTLGRSRFADNVASHFFIRKDPVISIACGDEHSAVVCQSGRLFVFGSNDWGQLGLGHKNHVSKPSCVKSLKPEKVSHVACGRAHTLICTDGQKIFACGSDQESQLGRGQQTVGDSSSSPIMIYDCGLAGPRVVQIAAGSQHSLVLTSDGGVLAWGSNLEGQLGLHGVSGLINTPTRLHIPEPVKQISAGYYHSAFLTESGAVYVCGEAESGKLGIVLDFRTQLAPKQMSLSVKAAHVACGGHHTLVFGDDGKIYCTGSNASGQLGMGTSVTEIQTPKPLEAGALEDEKIVKVVCGESHIAVLTGSGKIFTCGDGRHGKLGLEENENNVHELTYAIKYQELFVTNVACGGCHTILVGRRRETENGDDESKQMKINALPPLKVPTSRIQNESPIAKPDGPNIGSNEENDNETESTPEKNEHDNVGVADPPENDVDKPESPKKSVDYGESEEIKVKEDEMSNEKNQTTVEPEFSEERNSPEDSSKGMEKPEGVKRPKSSVSRVSRVEDKTIEGDGDEAKDDGEKISEESQNGAEMKKEEPESPPLPVPPPKPPRQKTGSAGSGSSGDMSRKSSGKVSSLGGAELEEEEKKENNAERNSREENETASRKKSASSENSQSGKSKAESNETVPMEETIQSTIEKIGNEVADKVDMVEAKALETVVAIEEKIGIATDDADVVQSPVSRGGKISKLFHLRRQEVENGNKLSSPQHTKAKSKTCSIL